MSLLEYLCSDLQSTQLVIFQDKLNVNWLFMILCLDCPDLNYFVKLTGSNVLYISKVVISMILRLLRKTLKSDCSYVQEGFALNVLKNYISGS